MDRMLLWASLLLNAGVLLAAAVVTARRGGLPYLRRRIGLARGTAGVLHDEVNYARRLGVLEVLPGRPGGVVMLGDSITEGCEWGEMLGRPDVANRGIGGDTSAGVLRRLDGVIALRPAAVCLMIGINDLGNGVPPGEVAANVRTILARLRAAGVPEVVVQSVLPLRRVAGNPYRAIVPDAAIAGLNEMLRDAAAGSGCAFLELHPVLAPGGELAAEYTGDGLHLTGAAYRRWAAQLLPLLPVPRSLPPS